MTLSLESAQTIALGPFNPHIITPEWLSKQDIYSGELQKVQFNPLEHGIIFRFKDVEWDVDFESLLVASPNKDCGQLVEKVIGLLIHTPVRAVGNNFHYAAATMKTWGDSPLPQLGFKTWANLADAGTVDQIRWEGVFLHDGVRVQVTLGQSESGVVVLFNFHRKTSSPDAARQAAAQFNRDKATSRELLDKLFRQEAQA